MKKREKNAHELKVELLERYPALEICREQYETAYAAIKNCYAQGGKVLVAGNGGSASDSEHIVGELMKSFLFNRKIDKFLENKLEELYQEDGKLLASKLEGALPAIPLTSMIALSSAYANDVDAAVAFAQMVNGLGSANDIFLGISTSGNSKNVLYAFMVAKSKGIKTIALTGKSGGKCGQYADIIINVPSEETFKIQEYHLPIYHTLCAMLEADFFVER